jgi:ubiquinone/menaquinone biosynthesis C-methylase UbiE
MAANYDSIAKIYDLLSRVVFGKYIIKAQVCLIEFIRPGNHILIVGGGTGWILEEISKQYDTGLTIDYIESSAAMITLSEKRNSGTNQINFFNQPVEDFAGANEYDIIFTPFLFDNFKPAKARQVFNNLHELLKRKGIWLYADFVYEEKQGKWWQKGLLKTMYLFFRITANIETSELENMEACFSNGYNKIFECWFYGRFIRSQAYQKI